MNKEKINAGIDRMAEEAKETMNLMSDKIDRATRCGNEKAAPFGDAAACMKPQAKQPAARPLLLERIAPAAAGAIDSQATRDVGQKNFAILKSLLYLCTAFERRIELWCNGNTSDFGSEILGSSPDSSTKMRINEFLFIRIYSFPIEPDRSAG